jgi:transcription initiation factor TFIIF subunit beta
VSQLDRTPRVHKPVAYHPELEKPKQVEKRARAERELVLDLIFTAFQSHQYYSLKDLVHKTKQPTVSHR